MSQPVEADMEVWQDVWGVLFLGLNGGEGSQKKTKKEKQHIWDTPTNMVRHSRPWLSGLLTVMNSVRECWWGSASKDWRGRGEVGRWKTSQMLEWETCVGWQKYFNLGHRTMLEKISCYFSFSAQHVFSPGNVIQFKRMPYVTVVLNDVTKIEK